VTREGIRAVVKLRVFQLLHRAHRAVFRAADQVLAREYGITAAQNSLLLYLEKNEGVTMSAVAEAIGLKNAAVSGLVDRMAKKGLIARQPNARDGRSVELVLLPPGREIAAHSHAQIAATNENMLEGFDTAERETISRFLKAVVEKADAVGGEARPAPVASQQREREDP
jgi:DNA-binding MarR family transcriptional regulator